MVFLVLCSGYLLFCSPLSCSVPQCWVSSCPTRALPCAASSERRSDPRGHWNRVGKAEEDVEAAPELGSRTVGEQGCDELTC